MNLLANAIDAVEESNVGRSNATILAHPNRITIRTTHTEHQVQIAIADNGKGMSESVRACIFDHLFTTKGVAEGTGLGLAIAQQIIVEKHHGTITVDSTLDEGTTFVVSLPICSD
jgi:signal transduction histidine kinase